MMVTPRCLPLLFTVLTVVAAVPTPGRIPKVYNALITSNQNLEPSKAFPLYQPVLHNTFPFPYQTIVYGDYPLTNGIIPVPSSPPKDTDVKSEEPSTPAPEAPPAGSTEKPTEPESSSPKADDEKSTPVPPPPKTESPIPLNEFGLPPQVLPISRFQPSYEYSPFAFPYSYSGLRFYDPYDPFGFSAFPSYPLYRPLSNVLGPSLPFPAVKPQAPATPESNKGDVQPPPAEPSELNVLNYSSKDPAIPNVPPPPLPQGGLKVDKE
ncbi:unnamed protein product [Danaus chrysippus]|uniref:(African queen) hypothetical protein n=1 Tax=Danaus chrysippus TaxID=151541 RepID=A0A8J2R2V8_9NEOP|nr:unnamed protein product [Danaus chrysippus]